MRIWDVSPDLLCRNHLLGEHRELHAMWSIITEKKKGYSKHPETLRWKGKLNALYLRHEKLVSEMNSRGYLHKSPLDKQKATGKSIQNSFVHSINEQINILKNKKCDCKLP
ncbi:pyrimidine dimer DNA glycosylase/endonuclease V [Nitrosopumilus sp.]|uniref:pyrimidine dimer DNA glycosylase/endonuclease V n=1 Tax=Nitrosopumilus sp. TaxID=2024843 RepID=UPI00247E142D|nr:pyrimidine dimer DNA glycosylase/endonuclease V [Nitrosopumilus sp.]MCV0430250.1 pyrimidine dimer DNA glycosylase/endonuclease V [Nitrosopumilus sp.]